MYFQDCGDIYMKIFFLMIRRPPRSTLDRSSAASDVYKRQLLRAPLKPTVPAESHASVSPFMSVIVIMVLLNVALTCAIALRMFFLTFFLPICVSRKAAGGCV